MALHLPTKLLKHALHWTGGGLGNQRCDVLATTSLTSLVAMAQEKEEETILSCPHTFKFWTRLLMGTTSGMASDCVRCRGQEKTGVGG